MSDQSSNPKHAASFLVFFCCIFFLSGVAGLAYESVWTHYVKLFVGHASYAQSLVIAIFMGGMALGSWLCSFVIHKIPKPLIGYVLVECAIAAYAFAFDGLSQALLQGGLSNDTWLASLIGVKYALWTSAILLLLPGAILLGTTFPLFAAALLNVLPMKSGVILALIYGSNSLGAAFGVLLNGIWTVPNFGLPGALLFAANINVLIALVLYVLSKLPTFVRLHGEVQPKFNTGVTDNHQPETINQQPSINNQQESLIKPLMLVAAGTGMASFIYEILWLRGLSLAMGAATISFELMLSAFILGLAIGGFWIRKHLDQATDQQVHLLAKIQVAMGCFAILTAWAFTYSFDFIAELGQGLSRSPNGYFLYLVFSYALAILVMLPTTICAGMTLPLITNVIFKARGQAYVGKVYALNTLGSILGVVIALNWIMPLLGIQWGLALGALVDIALGLWLFYRVKPWQVFHKAYALVPGLLVLMIALLPHYEVKVHSSVFRLFRLFDPNEVERLFYQDGKTASISVLKTHKTGDISLASNGKVDASASSDISKHHQGDMPTQVLSGILPYVYHPNLKRAAIIGLGSGISSHTMLSSDKLERLYTVEIEPAVVEAARAFKPWNTRLYEDPRSDIVVEDGKVFFASLKQPLDAVVSEPSNPWVSGTASLFTQEFYQKVKSVLTKEGVLVQWLQTYEFNDALLASILNAIDLHFEEVNVHYLGSDALIVASQAPLSPDYDRVFAEPAFKQRLPQIGYRGPNDVAMTLTLNTSGLRLLASQFSIRNSDYFPFVDFSAPKARFLGQNAQFFVEYLINYNDHDHYDWWFTQNNERIQSDTIYSTLILEARQLSDAWLRPEMAALTAYGHEQQTLRSLCLQDQLKDPQGWELLAVLAHNLSYLHQQEATDLVKVVQQAPCFVKNARIQRLLTSMALARTQQMQQLAEVLKQEAIETIQNPLDELFVMLGIQRTPLRLFDQAVEDWQPQQLNKLQVEFHKLTYKKNDLGPFNFVIQAP